MRPQLARKSPPINHFDSRRNFCHSPVSLSRSLKTYTANQAIRLLRLAPSAARQATGCHCVWVIDWLSAASELAAGSPSATPQYFLANRFFTGFVQASKSPPALRKYSNPNRRSSHRNSLATP